MNNIPSLNDTLKSLVFFFKETQSAKLKIKLYPDQHEKWSTIIRGNREKMDDCLITLNFLFTAKSSDFSEQNLKTLFKISKLFRDDDTGVFAKTFCIDDDAQQYNSPLLLASQSDYFKKFFNFGGVTSHEQKTGFPLKAIAYINNYFLTGKLEKLADTEEIVEVINLAHYWVIHRFFKRLSEVIEPTEANIVPLLFYASEDKNASFREDLLMALLPGFRRNHFQICEWVKENPSKELQAFCFKGFLEMLKNCLSDLAQQESSPISLQELTHQNEMFVARSDEEIGREKKKEKEMIETTEPSKNSIISSDLKYTFAYLDEKIEVFDQEFLSSLTLGQLLFLLKIFPGKICALNFSFFPQELLSIFIPLLPSTLKSINLSHCTFTMDLLGNLANRCPNLEHLNLFNSKNKEINPEQFAVVFKNLKSFDMRGCLSSGDLAGFVFANFAASFQTLEELKIDGNVFIHSNAFRILLIGFIDTVKINSQKLTCFHFNYERPQEIIPSLLNSNLPQRLMRMQNDLYSPDASTLEALKQFPNLDSLYLDGNNLTNDDLIKFANDLPESLLIKNIYSRGSRIQGNGLLALIEKCPNVEVLKLSESTLSTECLDGILQKVSDNLRILHIQDLDEIESLPDSLLKLQHLTDLSIGWSYPISDNETFSRFFNGICKRNRGISRLALHGAKDKDITEGLSYLTQLNELILGEGVDLKILKTLARSCPNLTKLKFLTSLISDEYEDDEENIPILDEYIEAFCSLKNLQILKVPNCIRMPELKFIKMIQSLPSLHTLKFGSRFHFENTFYEGLAKARPDIKIYRKHFSKNNEEVNFLQTTSEQVKQLQMLAKIT